MRQLCIRLAQESILIEYVQKLADRGLHPRVARNGRIIAFPERVFHNELGRTPQVSSLDVQNLLLI